MNFNRLKLSGIRLPCCVPVLLTCYETEIEQTSSDVYVPSRVFEILLTTDNALIQNHNFTHKTPRPINEQVTA